MSNQPWRKAQGAPELPEDIDDNWVWDLDDETFALVLRANLVPRRNRAAWDAFWVILRQSPELKDDALDHLQQWRAVAETDLHELELDEDDHRRVREFITRCDNAASRLDRTDRKGPPLPWIPDARRHMSLPSASLISNLVLAITRHWLLRRDEGDTNQTDQELFDTLTATGFNPLAKGPAPTYTPRPEALSWLDDATLDAFDPVGAGVIEDLINAIVRHRSSIRESGIRAGDVALWRTLEKRRVEPPASR